MSETTAWKIWVSGYGEFDFEGTEAEAEEMRAHKAQWERGQGQKWRTDLSRESDRLTAEIVGLWSSRQGVPMALLSKRRRAREAEAGFNPEALLTRMGDGKWWAANRLAIELRVSRKGVSEALRKLKRRGLAEADGQLWRVAEPRSPEAAQVLASSPGCPPKSESDHA